MKIRPIYRVLLAVLSGLAFAGGCNTARRVSSPQPIVAQQEPKEQYDWKDMSTGKSLFRPINSVPKD